MGIVIKQTIKGTIWSYLGVVIGFITTSYLYPRYLTPEVVGLFGLLISYSVILANFANLGMNGVTARLFTYFRNKEKNHNGFLFLVFIIQVFGFFLFLGLFSYFKPLLIESNLEKSFLFSRYVGFILPITLFTLLFVFLDTFNKVLYDAVLGTFLQEFIQRFLILLVVLLFVFKLISLNQLIIGFTCAVSLKGVIILIYLLIKGEINLRPDFKQLNAKMKNEILNVALYSILGGLGSMLVFNIDKIVVNQMMDLSNTGVYTIAFYFGTLVVIPSRPLLKISGTLIADAWARDDIKLIESIYYRSCINQLIIGGFLFLGIWANIDNILDLLGPEYYNSKWVIFFIGLGYLFDMSTGANAQVIAYSKYYRISLAFIAILIGLVLGLLYVLIPIWGIVGAGIAIATSLFLNNIMRYVFLLIKYKMQPFTFNFLWIILIYTGIYFLMSLVPQQILIIDILLKGTLISILSFIIFWIFPFSNELKQLQKKFQEIIQKRK